MIGGEVRRILNLILGLLAAGAVNGCIEEHRVLLETLGLDLGGCNLLLLGHTPALDTCRDSQ
jgi:hypothetical protein